jgi:Lysylphosphatidylglycerol synthase TM region
MTARMRLVAAAITVAILMLIARRVAIGPLLAAFRDADYKTFLALMVPNTIFYFCWDTLVLTTVVRWFHADVAYREILPVRAASYVVGFFNTNAGRGAVAAYLWRRLDAPFLELGSTVIFLVLTEYTQLVLWAMLGLFAFRSDLTPRLLAIAASVAAFWIVVFAYTKLHVTPARVVRWILAPREWPLLRSFRLATLARYSTVVLLRAPMFAVSLAAHYYAAQAFGIIIPFGKMLTFLPVIFMAAALPVTVAHLGTTQAAWLFFFGRYAPAPRLLAFSLAAHLTFTLTRALLGVMWLPVAYRDLTARFQGRDERMMIGTPSIVDSRN